jgi:phosphoribosylformylglycinamidine synthase subunit PurS
MYTRTQLVAYRVVWPGRSAEIQRDTVIIGCMKAHVWVMPKRTVLDPQGQTIQHALSGLGYKQIRDVRQGKFFVLNLDGWSRDEAQSQLERISKEVLTNPVIEEYRFEIVD